MELRNRNLLDAAVQESYLAVPYAFGKLNANAQSADYYERAIESFDTENGRLDAAIARIGKGDMLERVLAVDKERDSERAPRAGWFWQLKNLPDAPESRYLYAVLAGHDFQEGLKNYRDMVFLQGTLAHWSDSMDAYQDMIGTRDRAYAERVPRTQELLASGAVDHLQQRDVALQNRLREVEARHDVGALGTDHEREQWARVQRVESALSGAPDTPENATLRERLALVKGVLQLRLDDAWNARLWQEHRDLKDLDLALREAQSRWIRVQRALHSMPANTGEFAARAAALRARIDAIQARIAATQQKQNAYLAQIAVNELAQQKERLATYQVQARFALASMYDRAANAESSAAHAKSPTPVQKGAEADQPDAAPDAAPPPVAVPPR
jgi:hypothetical protein